MSAELKKLDIFAELEFKKIKLIFHIWTDKNMNILRKYKKVSNFVKACGIAD